MTKRSALDEQLAALAEVAPADFVRERNALAGKLKAKDAALARAIRGVPKPSPTAWVLSQLARRQELHEYLEAADRLRAVQTGRSKAGDLGKVIRAERAARQDVVKRATRVLTAAKIKVTQAVRRRLADTLLAAATGSSRKDLERGLLRADLEPTGLPDVDLATALKLVQPAAEPTKPATPPKGRLRLVKPARDEQRAREAKRREREEAAEAKRVAAATKKAVAAHARRVKAAEAALHVAEERLSAARADVEKRREALAALKSLAAQS